MSGILLNTISTKIPTKIPTNKIKILELDKTVLVNGFIKGSHGKRVSTMPGYCTIIGDDVYLSDTILDYVSIVKWVVNQVNLGYENTYNSIDNSTISVLDDEFKNKFLVSSGMLFYVNEINESDKEDYLSGFREFILSSKILASVTIQPGVEHYLNLQEQLKLSIPEFYI